MLETDLAYIQDHTGVDLLTPLGGVQDAHAEVIEFRPVISALSCRLRKGAERVCVGAGCRGAQPAGRRTHAARAWRSDCGAAGRPGAGAD